MQNNEYYTNEEVLEILKIHNQTLYRWRKANKVKFIQLSKKKFLYKKEDIDRMLGKEVTIAQTNNRKNVIYCRVSNQKQKDDLLKQKQLLTDYCNINGIIPDMIFSEIASGMNENRSEFNKLIDLVINNEVDKIFITYKDNYFSVEFIK